MTDTFTKEKRSDVMSRIRSRDTKPEKLVRSYLYSRGVRFRLHRKDLPGKPDITLSRINSVIFVHGCFWHHHKNCKRSNWPKSNVDYWKPKINKNILRDKQHLIKLKELEWKPLVIWACQVNEIDQNRELNRLVLEYNKSLIHASKN